MSLPTTEQLQCWENNEEIKIFREYLRIPSVHPDIDYDECISFLRRQATTLNLPMEVYEVNPKKPVVIITWQGTDPSATSIILNSHMDVVPVYPEHWTHPPFSAHLDGEGRLHARGAQDMKCVGVQYLGAIRALKREGVRLKRTLHVLFVPDEETGGVLGMKDFVRTERFRELNCGFALDEGDVAEDECLRVFYGERIKRRVYFHISGTPGHGSLLLKDTAGEKARKLIDKLMDLRSSEARKLADNPELTEGDITTVNLTMMQGGVQSDVVPPEMMICFDIRATPNRSVAEFESQLEAWCEESGGGIQIDYGDKDPVVEPTKLDGSNPFWGPFRDALSDTNLKVTTEIMSGNTDILFVRELGIPAFGFSPIYNTQLLYHDHNEYLHAEVFLKGIDIYRKVIKAVAYA
ncbi:aminoacylase-1B-like [Culex pipiens pallens]|uniref:aminoacylase-1B-like n=1 Tax=Culex pipiens pallens TaxID=42434 RepID=UPI00195380D2|nr:aminoacylase-1B-like [Culex pipiens pallens]